MKKLHSFLVITLLLFVCLFINLRNAHCAGINSVSVYPANPVNTDYIGIVVNVWTNHSGCWVVNQNMNVSGTYISGLATYCDGALTSICGRTDTFWVGTLTDGMYAVDFDMYYGGQSCINASYTGTDSLTFIVGPPAPPTANILANGPTDICNGDSVELEANQGVNYSYQWLWNGNHITGATSANYWATQTGQYQAIVSNTNGSDTSNSIHVTVTTLNAMIVANGPTTFCEGDSVELDGTTAGATIYEWWMNGSTINGANNPTYMAHESGNYQVIAGDSICADTSHPEVVAVNPSPHPMLMETANETANWLECPDVYTSYQWYDDAGNAIAGANTHTYQQPTPGSGSYYVSVTDSNGCTGNSDTLLSFNSTSLEVASPEISPLLLFPNPASNSVTILYQRQTRSKLRLYNALGKEVYHQWLSPGHSNPTLDLTRMPAGVYVVVVGDEWQQQVSKLLVTD